MKIRPVVDERSQQASERLVAMAGDEAYSRIEIPRNNDDRVMSGVEALRQSGEIFVAIDKNGSASGPRGCQAILAGSNNPGGARFAAAKAALGFLLIEGHMVNRPSRYGSVAVETKRQPSAFHVRTWRKWMLHSDGAAEMAHSSLRVMTWNIHGARTMLGRPDLGRIISHVELHSPDIIALQEVDARRCGDPLAFDTLAGSLGEHRAEARMIVAPEGDYGHVLLTRWPIVRFERHDISVARREPRAALEAVIATPSGLLRVIAVHLGLSLRERHWQARRLATLALADPLPLVMLGDFNDWVWHGSVQRALREMFPGRSRFRTFPATFPLFRLDRIYVRPARLLKSMRTDRNARLASDHLPVIADLDPRLVAEEADGSAQELADADLHLQR